jgi:RNA polymerase sigma-70 factor (ECF subfamily)
MTASAAEDRLEAALVERARAGDEDAFCELVRLHQAHLHVFVASYLPGADAADDVAQDAFLIAYRKLGEFRTDQPLLPWLLGIARRRVLQHLRDEARLHDRHRRSLATGLAEWRLARLETESEADSDAVVAEREIAALTRCLEGLPASSGQLVTEFYFEARPIPEIASRLNKREGAVRMALLRVRQALRQCVEHRLAAEAS